MVAWEDVFFCILCLLVGNGGTPLPWTVFWNQYFSWVPPARSLRNKDLEVTSLFFFHLGTFCRRFGLWDGRFLLSPDVGPPFRPDQKVKLDKSEATRGAFSCVVAFLVYDGNGHTLPSSDVMKKVNGPAQAKLGRGTLQSWGGAKSGPLALIAASPRPRLLLYRRTRVRVPCLQRLPLGGGGRFLSWRSLAAKR